MGMGDGGMGGMGMGETGISDRASSRAHATVLPFIPHLPVKGTSCLVRLACVHRPPSHAAHPQKGGGGSPGRLSPLGCSSQWGSALQVDQLTGTQPHALGKAIVFSATHWEPALTFAALASKDCHPTSAAY